MYSYEQIREVHLEISSRCNAACPLCPRNLSGYPYNDGYIEHDMSLAEAKQIFQPEFLLQINHFFINGNFGDIVMNSDAIPIIEYFLSINPAITIVIHTNGGARDKEFWKDLARLNCTVFFALDGFEDTHHLYRQNTSYDQVIKNAKTFIAAGGRAVWKMIDFDHNRHQQEQAKTRSVEFGFAKFMLFNDGRVNAAVFNKKKELTHTIGNAKPVKFQTLFDTRTKSEVLLEDIVNDSTPKPISCQVSKNRSVYVSSTGDVYPCCFLGFSPKTYGHGNFHQAANAQFKDFITNNNALNYTFKECIEWFSRVTNTWEIPTFEQGRLIICNNVCGSTVPNLNK
jgi:sulfatase maturation enzyme AslB (radical SAM superfamily)